MPLPPGIRRDDWDRWCDEYLEHYEDAVYKGNPLVGYFLERGHVLIEREFGVGVTFEKVLEVGAGSGVHFSHVKHAFAEYHMTDHLPESIELLKQRYDDPRVRFYETDATRIDAPDDSFDRLIAIHVLEHLPHPHQALQEWARVLRNGGILSIVLPTEGGLWWNIGRYLTTRRSYGKLGFDYDYIQAREHVSACYRLVAILRHYFPQMKEIWYPLHVPSTHLNLLFVTNIAIEKS
jgi:SAM-dependent methyltransferase